MKQAKLRIVLIKTEAHTKDGRSFPTYYGVYSPDGKGTLSIKVKATRRTNNALYDMFRNRKGFKADVVLSAKDSAGVRHNGNGFVTVQRDKDGNIITRKNGSPAYVLVLTDLTSIESQEKWSLPERGTAVHYDNGIDYSIFGSSVDFTDDNVSTEPVDLKY